MRLLNGDIFKVLAGYITRFSRSQHIWSRVSQKTLALRRKFTV